MLDEPTRGVDVGAKAEIYRLLFDSAERGIGILVSSSETPELLTLCDRILVMFRGRSSRRCLAPKRRRLASRTSPEATLIPAGGHFVVSVSPEDTLDSAGEHS